MPPVVMLSLEICSTKLTFLSKREVNQLYGRLERASLCQRRE